MANHRPKSLSELNNVYDKAMRAEKAIKEGSSLLSTPETEAAPESEDIFTQLEAKAAEAQKREVFDPDITDIANDFLKRYAQPAKPKPAPQEIKRPAPSIQSVYHSPVREAQPEKHDVPLSMGTGFAPEVKPQSVPVHKPSHTMPSTEAVRPEVKAPEQEVPAAPQPTVIYQAPEAPVAQPTVIYQAPEEPADIPAEPVATEPAKAPVSVKAPEVKTPAPAKAPVAPVVPVTAEPQTAVDHTPRPAPSRVRITSTERSELMEEYLRVMSDEDDEPSERRPKFSFFKKKKKHEKEEEHEEQTSLYEELPEDEDSAEEIPVVPFDSSEVKYTDEYSDAPEKDEAEQEPMNLYDYIEADFDYDEEGEDVALDMSFSENEEAEEASAEEEIAFEEAIEPEEGTYPTEPEEGTYPTEPEEGTYPTEPEEGTYPTEPEEEVIYPEEATEEVIYPEEATEEAEETAVPEEGAVYEEDPTAGMVFEDVFSVSDESKRSHTGGNWSEVLSEAIAEEQLKDEEKSASEEVTAEEAPEAEEYAEYTENDQAEEVYEEVTEEAEETEDTDDSENAEEEDYEAPKKRTFLKILMALATVLCLSGAGISLFLSAVVGVDSGKLFSERYRAFSVSENMEAIGLSKGDLVITENTYAQADQLYVYTDADSGSYGFGRVNAVTTSITGDYLYITQSKDSVILINRDTSLGVVTKTYGGIGTLLSVICDYGIFIAAAFVIFAAALIICLIILIRRQRRYEEAAAIYDNPDNFTDGDDSDDNGNNPSGTNEEDSEYYSDYDTDGIEQGLFVSI